MKKDGVKIEKKKALKCINLLIVLLFVIGTLLAPAAAKKEDEQAVLDHIDEKLEALDANTRFNTFLYNIMLEYKQPGGLKAVKIVIREGRWWWSREVKTFYVVRDNPGINITESYPLDDGTLWTFYPNIGQSIDALNIISSCFEGCECESDHKAVLSFIKFGITAIKVDKDNVPPITEIISNSHWLNEYLPSWAKDFIEKFESVH